MPVYDYVTDDTTLIAKEENGETRIISSIFSSGQVTARNTREARKLARAEIRACLEDKYSHYVEFIKIDFKAGPSLTLMPEAEKEEVAGLGL